LAVLSHFLLISKNLAPGKALSYSAAALLAYLVIGWLWQRPRVMEAAHA
jgi:hypothetical protein